MVDAMGVNLARLKHPGYALAITLDDAFERCRSALRAPVGTSRQELVQRLPADLAQAISQAADLKDAEVPRWWARQTARSQVVLAAQRLEEQVLAFERDTRTRRLG